MSTNPKIQNPLLQQLPVTPDTPLIISNQYTTTPAPTISAISLENLENEISRRNKLILERLTLENAQIDDYISMLNNQRSTDKIVIESNSYYYNLLNNIYTPLFFTYFVCLIILGFFFFIADTDLALSLRVLLMVAFIFYPFAIYYLEDWTYSWFEFFYSYLRFTPIGSNPIKDALSSQPFLHSQRFSLQEIESNSF